MAEKYIMLDASAGKVRGYIYMVGGYRNYFSLMSLFSVVIPVVPIVSIACQVVGIGWRIRVPRGPNGSPAMMYGKEQRTKYTIVNGVTRFLWMVQLQ